MKNTAEYSLKQGQQREQTNSPSQGNPYRLTVAQQNGNPRLVEMEKVNASPSQVNVVSQQVAVGSYDSQPSVSQYRVNTLGINTPPLPPNPTAFGVNTEQRSGIVRYDNRDRTARGDMADGKPNKNVSQKSVKIYGGESPRFAAEETLSMITPSNMVSSIMINGVLMPPKPKNLGASRNQVSFSPLDSEHRPFKQAETNGPTTLVSVGSQLAHTN